MRANWTSAAGGLITETSFSRRSRGEVTVHAKGVRGRVLTSQRLGLRMPNLTETDWTRWSVEEFSGIGGGRWAFGLAALHVGCLIALDTSCSATAVMESAWPEVHHFGNVMGSASRVTDCSCEHACRAAHVMVMFG
jgi:hypothetical protein